MGQDQEVERIRAALRHDEPRRGSLPPGTAAVLAPLVPTPHGLHLLLERRPEGERPFAGQLSFPGGRIEPQDASPLAAALREAHEEVGFGPQAVEVLGHLTEMTNHLGRHVIAFVGVVPLSALPPVPRSAAEVDELLLVPLDGLRTPGMEVAVPAGPAVPRSYRVLGYEARLFAERAFTLHYFRLEPRGKGRPAVLWGLTAEMTARLLGKAYGWTPPAPPRPVHRREDVLP